MAISVSAQQVAALAPDEASAKAARALASPRSWSGLGQDGQAIWGAIQGSGKNPYLTQVDWTGPAFKCSCPSRKFPCKHGLALLFLLAEQPGLYTEAERPAWVKTWLEGRTQRAEAQSSKEPTQVDEAARAKRAEQRENRVSAGLDLLELWLRDLVQQGLASAPGRGFPFWDQQAARLVDAQAPGAARRVRELGGIAVSGAGWQERLVSAIGRLVLLIHAYRRVDRLPIESQADVRTAIGFALPHEDVLAGAAVRDQWLVAAQSTSQEDRLRVQRTWLAGRDSSRSALVLEFAVGGAGFKSNLIPGTSIDAEVCYHPGAAPLRALVRVVHSAPVKETSLFGRRSVAENQQQIGERLAANPWTETQPVLLKGVVPVLSASGWFLSDSENAMPCHPDYTLLSVSGGYPIDVAGESDGNIVRPLMACAAGRLATLRQGAPA
ncbi:MAG: SWIM zinc finger family protein [Paludibaculum sp.]